MCDESVKLRKLADMEDVNEDIISGKPWAQKLLTTTVEITKKAVLHWCNIICKIGESELDIEEYVSIFIKQVENLYEELITDVDTIQEKSLDKIVRLLQKMDVLCRDLHVVMPTFNYEDVPLCDLYRLVNEKVLEFESVTEIRKKELRELQQKQLKLCKNLGKEVILLSESPLPSSNEVDALRVHIEKLENEAMEREEKFFQLKEEIVEVVKELGASPSLDFEKEILNMTNTQVRIADSEMEQLEMYRDRIVAQMNSVREEIAELRNKIDNLWDKLETDIAERDAFREKNIGNTLETLDALKLEVERLDEMKKANIKGFINKQRQELASLWEKCHCTDDDKKEFNFYYSECYNEDLFELHEREIDKWKAYYEENKEIFKLLQEYKNLWNEHLELELNSQGANRYKNRGGQLLTEEKMRNKFRKMIPKTEEKLLKVAESYFTHKGKHFRTFGSTIEEYVQKLHEEQDQEFKLKLSAKKQQREQVPTPGRSRMNLFPTSSLNPTLTPRHCSTKRKNVLTPITEPSKKFKQASNNRAVKTGLPKLNVSRNKRRSARREKLKQRLSFKSSKSSQNSNKENADATVSTNYHDFEKEVSTRNNCRSTILLKESNLLSVPVTPIKKEFLPPGITYLQNTPRNKRAAN